MAIRSSFGRGYFVPKLSSQKSKDFLPNSSPNPAYSVIPGIVAARTSTSPGSSMNSNSPAPKKSRYVDILGVCLNLTSFLPSPRGCSSLIGWLDMAARFSSIIISISNIAFFSGWSKQGNALRASLSSNWVTAMYLTFPSLLY